jgi:DNA-binding CsgD family transcriptional regulator
MADRAPPGGPSALLRLTTDVLEALDQGTGGRTHFCEAVATLYSCTAVAHAWLDGGTRTWSLCLWRRAREGAGTVTLAQVDDGADIADPDERWLVSPCRRLALDWMVVSHLAEAPLTRRATSLSMIVLGREHAFGNEDARLVSSSRPLLAMLERIVLRLEPPAPPAGTTTAGLSDRELEVLDLLAGGLTAHAIARRLAVSERTVHKHVGSIYRKLDVHDRLLAVARARELGLLAGAGGPAALGGGAPGTGPPAGSDAALGW